MSTRNCDKQHSSRNGDRSDIIGGFEEM